MLGFALSQLTLRALSALLGGYGIFCLVMSFDVPWLGAKAFLLLVTATAIVYFCCSERR
jgi:uncharacterized membrane protein (DUF485 family)